MAVWAQIRSSGVGGSKASAWFFAYLVLSCHVLRAAAQVVRAGEAASQTEESAASVATAPGADSVATAADVGAAVGVGAAAAVGLGAARSAEPSAADAKGALEEQDPALFARPAPVVEALAETAGAGSRSRRTAGRRLEEVETQASKLGDVLWEFPLGTTLSAESLLNDADHGSGFANAINLALLAGYPYSNIEAKANAEAQFGVQHTGGAFKLVKGSTTRKECHLSFFDVPMASTAADGLSPLAMGEIEVVYNLDNKLTLATENPHLVFMNGGEYQICYNPTGGFSDPDVLLRSALVPVPITVYGVDSGCGSNDCLAREKWNCYFSYRAESQGPCILDVRNPGGRSGWSVKSFGASRASWTRAWDSDTVIPDYAPAAPLGCSDHVSGNTIAPESRYFKPLENTAGYVGVVVDEGTAGLFPGIEGSKATDSFTVTACFCANMDGPDGDMLACNEEREFHQAIGSVHFWLLRLCDVSSWMSCGFTDLAYARIMPQQPFVLRLQCPPGGVCIGESKHRLKFLAPNLEPETERPTWHLLHGCRQDDAIEATNVSWILPEGVTAGNVTGGIRRDYKAWSDAPLLVTKTFGQSFDVCYCDTGCDDPLNFFKVGSLRTVETIGVARWHRKKFPADLVEPLETLKYVRKTGSLTLFAGSQSPLNEDLQPYDSVPFTQSGLVKIISYDRDLNYHRAGDPPNAPMVTLEQSLGLDKRHVPGSQVGLDAACRTQPYSEELTSGPTSDTLAKEYIAHVPAGTSAQYLPFSGKMKDQVFVGLRTGVLSICYCGRVDPATEACEDDKFWMHAARLMIVGPEGGAVVQLPTNFVVRIELAGWGFNNNNTLRAVTTTQRCSANSFRPEGLTGYFKLGCPGLNSTGCRFHDANTHVNAYVEGSDSTGIYIDEIIVGERNTTLHFTGDILEYLVEGDAITIDEDTLLYRGRGKSTWTEGERYVVSKLSGFYSYADTPGIENEGRMLWNRVSYVYDNQNQLDRRSLMLNVGWPAGQQPYFELVGGRAFWSQRNKLRTKQEIYAEEGAVMKLCWATYEDGFQRYYGDAGVLAFVDPVRMDDAGVHVTGQEAGAQVPVVLSFSPALSRADYEAIDQPMVLRLLFRDVDGMITPLRTGQPGAKLTPLDDVAELPQAQATQGMCGMLFAEMWTNDVAGFPLVRGCYYGPKYSDEPANPEAEPPGGYREYFIIFEKGQGIKRRCVDGRYRSERLGSCVYQVVVNAIVGDKLSLNKDAVSFYSMCQTQTGAGTPCGKAYGVVEYGRGRPSRIAYPSNSSNFQLGRIEMGRHGGVRYGTQHETFKLDAESTSTAGVRYMSLEMRAWPRNPANPVLKGAVLRVFFLPLTAWHFQDLECEALCIPPANISCSDGRDGSMAFCYKLPVVDTLYEAAVSMPRNMIRLEYPRAMQAIPLNRSNEAQVLEVNHIDLPKWGFFPRRFLAQLGGPGDIDPSVMQTVQVFSHVPVHGATVGMLLAEGQAGCGPKPFRGDKENELMVRLTIGFTVHYYDVVPVFDDPIEGEQNETNDTMSTTTTTATTTTTTMLVPPVIQIELPPGYECFVVGDGTADVEGKQEFFNIDANEDGYLDNYKGTLKTLGRWSSAIRNCTFTLDNQAALFFGQVFYFKISITNPWDALHRDDPRNIWNIIALGRNSQILQPKVPFISLEEERELGGWVGNLAVLSQLAGECVQPNSFLPSDIHELHVWFQAVHWMPQKSYILVDAPLNFDFFELCNVSDLPDEYYVDYYANPWGEGRIGDRARLRPLGFVHNCTGEQWHRGMFDPPPVKDFNRARIRISTVLEPGAYYGFRVRVKNPPAYAVSMHEGWRLFVQSPDKYPLDGSRKTVVYSGSRVNSLPNSIYDMSWGMYSNPLADVNFSFGEPFVLPSSVGVIRAKLEVFPFTTSENIVANIRIIAPVGYEWMINSSDGFWGQVDGKTCGDRTCRLYSVPRVPELYKNELILPIVALRTGTVYGFTTWMSVPDRPPTRSTNAFFFELGYDDPTLGKRSQAGILPAPPLRALSEVSIFSLCNGAGYDQNVLEIHFITVTELRANEGFIFKGDKGNILSNIECFPHATPGSLPLPEDLKCQFFEDLLDGLPVVILSVTETRLPAGRYGVKFVGMTNGLYKTEVPPMWNIGTFSNVSRYPAVEIVDKAVDATSSRLKRWMDTANFMDMPEWLAASMGRDDRPNETNLIVIYAKLLSRQVFPPAEPYIALRGPDFFIFSENCSSSIKVFTNETNATANSSNATNVTYLWPCTHEPLPSWCPALIQTWPEKVKPIDCLGLGRTAKISFPPGVIDPDLTYAFQIAVRNPFSGDGSGQWAVDFGDEASEPFQTFMVRTFDVDLTSMYVVSRVVSQPDRYDISTPIAIFFVPSSDVPARGPSWKLATIEGRLVFEAPPGFMFDAKIEGSCHKDTTLEVADRLSGDFEAVYTFGRMSYGADVTCTVEDRTRLVMRFGGKKPLLKGVKYRLVALLRNPEEPVQAERWRLLSYKQNLVTGQVIPIDKIVLEGFDVGAGLPLWEVINFSEEFLGLFKVRTVTFSWTFESDFMDGDYITITAPTGFYLLGDGSPATVPNVIPSTCDQFRWPTAVLPMPDSPPPICACTGETAIEYKCQIVIKADEPSSYTRGNVVLEKGSTFRFNISAINPAGPPDIIEAYWHVFHRSKDDLLNAASAIPTWAVFGQLRDISLNIVSLNTRAGSVADLSLSFKPDVWAFVLEVILIEPKGFDFKESRFLPPFKRDDRAVGNRLVVSGGAFPANEQTTLKILSVKMAEPGGPTRFTLKLFKDIELKTQVAERLNIIKGFRVPGALEVIAQRMWSPAVVKHHEEEDTHDVVIPLLPPYATEKQGEQFICRAEVLFTVTMPSFSTNHLIIRSELQAIPGADEMTPYRPWLEDDAPPTLDLCDNMGMQVTNLKQDEPPADFLTVAPMLCKDPVPISFTEKERLINPKDELPDGMKLTMNQSALGGTTTLEVGKMYRLRFWTQASQHPAVWLIATDDDEKQLQNSNDAQDSAVRAVSRMVVRVRVAQTRIPPESVLDVDVTIIAREDQEDFSQIEVGLPPGFAPYGMGFSSNPLGTKRLVVRLDVDQFALQELKTPEGKVFGLRLLTPPVTPLDKRWFVMAYTVSEQRVGTLYKSTARMTGWGVVDGFDVAPLPANLVYAPVREFSGWLAISFVIPTEVRGQYVQIIAPRDHLLTCPDGNLVKVPCESSKVDGVSTVNVTMMDGVVAGANVEYSYLLSLKTPELDDKKKAETTWQVKVLNKAMLPVDGTGPWIGRELLSLFLLSPTLSWRSPPKHGETSAAVIEITFERRVPKVKALLITLPMLYRHDIQHRNQFKSVNRIFPVAIDVEWRNFENLGWVRVLMNDAVSEARDFLPTGTFQFEFPVRIPKSLPTNMEWYVSICSDFTCKALGDPSIIASFPVPNIEPIDAAMTWAVATPTSSTIRATTIWRRLAAAVALVLSLGVLAA
eukprot:TRINITY_DN6976_c0_g2_i1.p1 TRINITY_DN6976_c0_g2~~TRINITY_DN6976_c0_g2_i1.p1  ORF type:complete len:3484 (-),score=772.22 TRINITY_DN6976_c0_g2_i1:111-10493(-)